MQRIFIIASGLSGTLSVILGALGAHALKTQLSSDQLISFKTAVSYQMYHAIALLVLAILMNIGISKSHLTRAGYCFIAGTVLFSGSIYILSTRAITNLDCAWLGPITPLGGLLFVAGWISICLAGLKHKTD